MAPQSEPGEGSHNNQEQMSPSREDSVLGTCSGKEVGTRSSGLGRHLPFLLQVFVEHLLSATVGFSIFGIPQWLKTKIRAFQELNLREGRKSANKYKNVLIDCLRGYVLWGRA